jgi:hypothetical protein
VETPRQAAWVHGMLMLVAWGAMLPLGILASICRSQIDAKVRVRVRVKILGLVIIRID